MSTGEHSGERGRDGHGFLLPGTPVEWRQRRSGARKEGVVVEGFHGLYGRTYFCRARGWAHHWTTQVVESDLTLSGSSAEPRAVTSGAAGAERPTREREANPPSLNEGERPE